MRHDVRRELAALCARNRDGSFATQKNRRDILDLAGKQLQKAGFQNLAATSLKTKHVEVLVQRWQSEGLSTGTIKNRMAALRWWAEKVQRQNCVPRTNKEAGIDRRVHVPTETKAFKLTAADLERVDARLGLVLQLEAAFGLRREESLKFRPSIADKGDILALKGSWCKSGRPRDVPVRTQAQRGLLEAVRAVAGGGSMIPADMSYKQGLEHYKAATLAAGLRNCHGLRHDYAQERFKELAGFPCPLAGGPTLKELSPAQKQIDYAARLQVSRELGHNRVDVAVKYLGR